MSSLHSASSSTTSSHEGSAYPWILEHVLTYPGTYEIPLRTMYTLNSTPSSQQQPRQSSRANTPSLSSTASTPDGSPQSPHFPMDQQQHRLPEPTAADHFKQCLMEHISQLPSQPFSLPPVFITSFVRRCFTEDLCMVDFTQALTAMDYLKDLDTRRRRELSATLQRLNLDNPLANQDGTDDSSNPRITAWVSSMQEKERKIEALYTQVYIGLRRWTLINEMRLEPFSKANSIAMLNTLYPPATAVAPTRQLTPHILASQRSAFFRYITGVEQSGKGILKNLELQGARPGEVNGWTVVREIVDKYLRTANGVIDECLDVTGPEYFSVDAEHRRRVELRADSGIGFAGSDRPSTSSSVHSKAMAPIHNKPLPASPHPSNTKIPSLPIPSPLKKRSTTLERITRELRALRNRNDVKEMPIPRTSTDLDIARDATLPTSTDSSKTRSIRKMKSTTSIGHRSHHDRSGSDEPMPDFDADMRRRHLIAEARRTKENRMSPDSAKGSIGTISLSRPSIRSFEIE